MKTSWSPQANQLMREIAERNFSIIRAAGAFNRTIASARVRSRKLGIRFPKPRFGRR